MGLRGPLPKSDWEKNLAGTWRKDRSTRLPSAPRENTAMPPSPMELSAEEQPVWDKYAPDLVARGYLDQVNAGLLAVLCTLEARFNVLSETVQKEGMFFTTPRGKTRERQESILQRRMVSGLMSLWKMFGLTPRSRRRLER